MTHRRRSSACWSRLTHGIALLFVVSGCAATGSIQGRVLVSGKAARADARASRAGATTPQAKTALKSLRDAVVFIEERPPKPVEKRTVPPTVPAPEEPLPPAAMMGQRDHCFIPHVLAVESGTTVQFENRDIVYHNVFSISPTHRFDTGRYAPGESKSITFDAPGPVQLFCEMDRTMCGYVFVTPNELFTRPDSSGRFSFAELPPGIYTLTAWHPTLGKTKRRVRLGGHLTSVTLKF
jgi:plastocyanin